MDEKTKEHLAFLKELYQEAPEAVIILDSNSFVMWTNKTVTNILKKNICGLSGVEILRQQNDVEISWPPDVKTINHRYVNGELMEMVSHKIPGSDYYLLSAHRLDGENGIRTIMEEKLAEVTADAVHDLKSPINGVYGFAGLSLDELEKIDYDVLKPEVVDIINNIKKYIEIVIKSSNALVSKIDNILILSRLENGFAKLQITEINMLNFTQTILEKFIVRAKKGNIKLSRKLTSFDYIIHADRDLLERALENMILNAIEELESNNCKKEISLHFGRDEHGLVSFEVTNPGAISAENRHKMFKDQFTMKKYGNGRGTKTIRLAAEAHGGSPSVKCEQGIVHIGISFPDAE